MTTKMIAIQIEEALKAAGKRIEMDCACGANLVLTSAPTVCPSCGRKYTLTFLMEIEEPPRKKRN